MSRNKGFINIVAAGLVALAIFAGRYWVQGSILPSAGSGGQTVRTSAGVTSLNGLTGATQTFVNDTNVTITSAGTTHTLGWSGTAADSRVADNLTISGGTIENTPIGAATPSTGIFSNSTSTNATSTTLNVSSKLTAGAATTTDIAATNRAAGCAQFATGGSLISTGSNCASGLSGGAANKVTYWSASDTITQSSYLAFDPTTFNFGIGTSSPFALLSLAGVSNGTVPIFSVSTSTAAATSTVFTISSGGNVGVSSSTPYAAVSLGNRRSIITSEYLLATSSSFNVSALDGNKQLARLGTGAVTITLIDFVPGASVNLKTCAPSSGTMGAITFAASPGIIAWTGGTAPSQTTTANKCDTWIFDGTAATSTLKLFGSQAPNY